MGDYGRCKTAAHHLSVITGAGRDEVVNFYSGLIEFDLVNEVEIKHELLLYFKLGEALLLEIICSEGHESGRGSEIVSGFAHFAFTVADVELWIKKVRDTGLEITLEPTRIPELHINTFLFKDPFGAVWELMEETE